MSKLYFDVSTKKKDSGQRGLTSRGREVGDSRENHRLKPLVDFGPGTQPL